LDIRRPIVHMAHKSAYLSKPLYYKVRTFPPPLPSSTPLSPPHHSTNSPRTSSPTFSKLATVVTGALEATPFPMPEILAVSRCGEVR
jgi:hypothetical protein